MEGKAEEHKEKGGKLYKDELKELKQKSKEDAKKHLEEMEQRAKEVAKEEGEELHDEDDNEGKVFKKAEKNTKIKISDVKKQAQGKKKTKREVKLEIVLTKAQREALGYSPNTS